MQRSKEIEQSLQTLEDLQKQMHDEGKGLLQQVECFEQAVALFSHVSKAYFSNKMNVVMVQPGPDGQTVEVPYQQETPEQR